MGGANKKRAVASSTTLNGVSVILGHDNLDIMSDLDFVICGDQVEKSKPEPEIYEKVRDHFGADLRYLVFEDTDVGVYAATRAKMPCIAVPNKFTANQDFSSALAVISNFTKTAIRISRE